MKQVYIDITKGYDGEVIKTIGPFTDEVESNKAFFAEIKANYMSNIYYTRINLNERNEIIIDFGSHKIFGRQYVKGE